MPFLELTPDMVGRRTKTPLALMPVAAAMLWPDDEDERKRVWEAAQARYFAESQRGMVVLDSSVLRWLHTTPRLPDIRSEIAPRYAHGLIAGMLFCEAARDIKSGSSYGLTAIKAHINDVLGGQVGFERLSVSTIDNTIWRRFRPVSHLWAAHYLNGGRDLELERPGGFPCQLDDLVPFLAAAEYLRREGENLRPRQSSDYLLDSRTTWAVPPGLLKCRVEFHWHRLPSIFSNAS